MAPNWDEIPCKKRTVIASGLTISIFKEKNMRKEWQWICKDLDGNFKLTTSFYRTIEDAQAARLAGSKWTVIEKFLMSEREAVVQCDHKLNGYYIENDSEAFEKLIDLGYEPEDVMYPEFAWIAIQNGKMRFMNNEPNTIDRIYLFGNKFWIEAT